MFEKNTYMLSPYHDGFLKEGDPNNASKTGTQFFVVRDIDGIDWLLKSVSHHDIMRVDTPALLKKWTLLAGESEVRAYQIGAYLGYPVPETKLVIASIDGVEHELYRGFLMPVAKMQAKSFIAYRFLSDAIDAKHGLDNFESLTQAVANTFDVNFRSIFSALLGVLCSDDGRQAMVSNNKYYAIDLACCDSPNRFIGDGWRESVVDYGLPVPDNEESAAIASAYRAGDVGVNSPCSLGPFIGHKDTQKAQEYFEKMRNMINANKTRRIIRGDESLYLAISQRASYLLELYDNNKFSIGAEDDMQIRNSMQR